MRANTCFPLAHKQQTRSSDAPVRTRACEHPTTHILFLCSEQRKITLPTRKSAMRQFLVALYTDGDTEVCWMPQISQAAVCVLNIFRKACIYVHIRMILSIIVQKIHPTMDRFFFPSCHIGVFRVCTNNSCATFFFPCENRPYTHRNFFTTQCITYASSKMIYIYIYIMCSVASVCLSLSVFSLCAYLPAYMYASVHIISFLHAFMHVLCICIDELFYFQV